jgi:Ca-activated chloride channel family protein
MRIAPIAAMIWLGAAGAPIVARASTTRPSRPTEGTLKVRDGKEVVDVPLRHTDVRIAVAGFLADVKVEQTFINPFDRKIDAVYQFPLPTRAAVSEMEIDVGTRTIRGHIDRRAEARRKYEEARGEGLVAALLTQERPNLFTQSVANLEPSARVVVRLRYVQPLDYEAGGYELAFPMVAGPRYVPPARASGPGEGRGTGNDAKGPPGDGEGPLAAPVLPEGMRSSHDIALEARIDAGVPVTGIGSPSHRIVVDGARVTLAAGDTIPNKDFILRYKVAGARPDFAVLTHRAAPAGAGSPAPPGSLFLLAQPPESAAPADITPREMVFVVDTSSSMAGEPLAKAKEVVRRALGAMGPDDTFQIIRFDDRAGALGARPLANHPRNVALALGWLDGLVPGGGTEMTSGVAAALDFPHDPARLRIVAFLTDGYIGNEDEVLRLVGARLGPARLFSFGVGSAVNRYLLEEMARVGRGAVEIVRPDEETRAAVGRFHDRIARPLLTDVSVDWNGLDVQDQVPAAIPDLFLGQPLVIAARYGRSGHAVVTVRARKAGQPVSFRVPVTLPERDDARPAVGSVWARARIAELSRQLLRLRDGDAEAADLRERITGIALEHHLMSRYTAFVAVDTTRVTGGGPAAEVKVPVEVPQGVRRPNSLGVVGEAYGYGGLGVVGRGAGGSASYGRGASDTVLGNEVSTTAGGAGSGSGAGYGSSAGYAPAASLGGRRARTPDVITGAITVRGTLDKEIIRRIVRRHQNEIKYCYEQALTRNHELEGRLVLELTIAANGAVIGSAIGESGLKDEALGACVVQAGRRWSFPAVTSGGVNVVHYPYQFKTNGSSAGDSPVSEEKKQ